MTTQKQLRDLPSLRAYADDLDSRFMETSALDIALDFGNRGTQAWTLTRIAQLLGWDVESGFCFSRVTIGPWACWRITAPDRACSFGADFGIEGLTEMSRSDAIAAILLYLENKKALGDAK
jgi:hypothetical protein